LTRRVEIDHSQAPVRMPAQILHELCQHALETLPEECCGLLVGNSLERYRRVVRCRNEMTARHQAGELVTAVYHSHVGAGAYLSEMDLAYAENRFFPFPKADQIVLPVYDRTVRDAAVFRRAGAYFTGHPIERVDP
jgi:proteasome lid subunit RPN8/RPN11